MINNKQLLSLFFFEMLHPKLSTAFETKDKELVECISLIFQYTLKMRTKKQETFFVRFLFFFLDIFDCSVSFHCSAK